jgi:hypothetical protein
MGNIIASQTGDTPDNIKGTSFEKNINDLLLELDLYSLPSSGTPRSVNINGSSVTPGEVDFSASGLAARKNSAGQYLDIKGIPYTVTDSSNLSDNSTKEIYNDNNNNAAFNLSTNTSNPQYYQNTSKYYNFKRAFCNATNEVPVNLLGVKLPSSTDTSASAVELNNCLTYGTTTAGSGTLTIPDINPATDTLNSASTGLTNKTVYGQPLSAECMKLLDDKITNSYINADVTKYTKLSSITDSSITGGNIDVNRNVLATDSNNNILIIAAASQANGTNNITNKSNTINGNYTGVVNKLYNTKDSGAIRASSNADVSNDCQNFYEKGFCDYYYQHDFIDGISNNPAIQAFQKANPNGGLLTNNFQYLSSHIPDCKCLNSLVFRADQTANGSIQWQQQKSSAGGNPIDYYWQTKTCDYSPNKQYGIQGSGITNYTAQPLYSIAKGNSTVNGFAAQQDPMTMTTNMGGVGAGQFIYAKGGRSQPTTINTYSCNIEQINNISYTGGGVSIGGSSLQCNFPNAPAGSAAATPQANCGTGNNAPCTSSTSATSSNTNTVVPSIDYNGNNIANQTSVIKPLNELIVTLNWPSNSALPSNFYSLTNGLYIPNYGFGFTATSSYNASTSIYTLGKFTCGNSTGPGTSQQSKCESIKLYTPFLYGTTSATNVDYSIYFMSITQTNILSPPPPPIPIKLNRYNMQITGVSPGKSSSGVFNLQFTIAKNTSDTFNLPYAIVLTPTDTSKPNVTLSGINLFTDLNNNTLTIGGTGGNTVGTILPISYTFSIILNPVTTSSNGITKYEYSKLQTLPNGGSQFYGSDSYLMNYSSSVPSSLSAVGAVINFATLQSGFTGITVGYINSSYSLSQLSSNASYPFGSILVINWSFTNTDGYTNIDFYYTYSGGSSPVKINTSSVSITTGTYSFVGPVFANATQISIYGQVSDTLKSNANFPISITSSVAPSSVGLYSVLSNQKLLSETTPLAITINPSSNNSIIDVLSKASNLYTAYNFTNNTFYTTSSNAAASTIYSSNTNYVIFKNNGYNTSSLPTISISLTDSNNAPISQNPKLQIGASINVNYVLSSPGSIAYEMQLYLFGIVYSKFTIPVGSTTGSVPITIYDNNGTIPSQPTNIQVQFYNSMKSNSLPVTIENPFIKYNTLSSDDNLSLTLATSTPFLYVSPNSSYPSLIKNIGVITPSENDNVYYNVFQGFTSSMTIESFRMQIQAADFTQPILINYTASNLSGFTNVSNMYDNIRKVSKKRETFGNTKLIEGYSSNILNINKLEIDLSKANGYNSNVTLTNQFNNYSTVNIQNLELYFGTNTIDQNTFSLSFVGTPTLNSSSSGTNTSNPVDVKVSTVTVVGIMTSSIIVPNTIPGDPSFTYSPDLQENDSWIYSFNLTNNSGVYSVLPSDSDAIAKANDLALNPPLPSSDISTDVAAEPAATDNSTMYMIIIGAVVVLIIIILMWFMFMKKKK